MHATPRRRRTLAAAALAFTLAAFAAAPFVRRSRACPIAIVPQPLRTLYTESDRVVVARVGETQLVARATYATHVRTALHVERHVKGKDEGPVVYVNHVTWEEEGVEKPGTFKRDERLLVFLKPPEEGEGYEVDDATYGVKKLTDDELKVYLARIEELRQIVETEKPDRAALVEWLVRCAEEQATRWEGAYELQLSADALARQGEQEEQPADSSAEAPVDTPADAVIAENSVNKHNATVEEYEAAVERAPAALASERLRAAEESAPPAAQAEALTNGAAGANTFVIDGQPVLAPFGPARRLRVERGVGPDPSLAAALGAEQKRRLADALFGAEKIGEGEDALIEVVKYFGDARFITFLVAQLRRVEDDPPSQAEAWLSALAHAMRNEEAVGLVSKYIEDVPYFEEEEETADGEEAEEADEAEEAEESATVDEAAAQRELEAREAAGQERARQKRSTMLKDLLAGVERILASPQVAQRRPQD